MMLNILEFAKRVSLPLVLYNTRRNTCDIKLHANRFASAKTASSFFLFFWGTGAICQIVTEAHSDLGIRAGPPSHRS